jgi:hypothetical protein
MCPDRFYMTGRPVSDGRDGGVWGWIVFFASLLIFSFCLTLVYHAMRGVMDLGGFVAYGGPYVIAHEAPGWVWVFPLSIFLMLASVFMSLGTSSKTSGPNLMSLSWSALFIALGWNFVEYGFSLRTGHGIQWGWAVCALIFVIMGLAPLVLILGAFRKALRDRRSGTPRYPVDGDRREVSWGLSLTAQAAVAAAGVLLGILFFRLIS